MSGNMIMSASSKGLPRKLTPVNTVGDTNQLFTVYEKNWHCPDCAQENYAARQRCFRCKKQKPKGLDNLVIEGAQTSWQEVIDPASLQIYYYNKQTGVTQWERPEEMGAAPIATGWFGRGRAGSSAAEYYARLNSFYLSRPARKQKDFVDPKQYHTEGQEEYNIWYGKFLGHENDKFDREPATDRCKLNTDAGFTRADTGGTQGLGTGKFFCLHFARGMCAKGADCTYFHRIPLPQDDARCEAVVDCFGRSRHSAHRDDMKGVGSFTKPCRTIFVGNLQKDKYSNPKELEETLWKHFGEWGELESLNVVYRLSIAFPRYRLRTSAEFAKEAMTNQALDHPEAGENLRLRWAHDDPNPVAQDAVNKADRDALIGLMLARGFSIEDPAAAPFLYPADYHLPTQSITSIGGYVPADAADLAVASSGSGIADYTATGSRSSSSSGYSNCGGDGGSTNSAGGVERALVFREVPVPREIAYPDTSAQYSVYVSTVGVSTSTSHPTATAAEEGTAAPAAEEEEYAANCPFHVDPEVYGYINVSTSSSNSSNSSASIAVEETAAAAAGHSGGGVEQRGGSGDAPVDAGDSHAVPLASTERTCEASSEGAIDCSGASAAVVTAATTGASGGGDAHNDYQAYLEQYYAQYYAQQRAQEAYLAEVEKIQKAREVFITNERRQQLLAQFGISVSEGAASSITDDGSNSSSSSGSNTGGCSGGSSSSATKKRAADAGEEEELLQSKKRALQELLSGYN